MPSDTKLSYLQVHSVLEKILGDDLHTKRVSSLAIACAQLSPICAIIVAHTLASPIG